MAKSQRTKTTILDIDGHAFDRHIDAVLRHFEALDLLYLSPRVKGALQDLGGDLRGVARERRAEIEARDV